MAQAQLGVTTAAPPTAMPAAPPEHSNPATPAEPQHSPTGPHTDPRRFLLDVMNNEALEMHLRIEAAKALLPLP